MKAVERCSDVIILVTCCRQYLANWTTQFLAEVAEKTGDPRGRCPVMPGREGSRNLDETFKAIYLWAQKAEALRSAKSAKWWDSLAPNPCALMLSLSHYEPRTHFFFKDHRGITLDMTCVVMESRFTRLGEYEQMSWSHCCLSSLWGCCCHVLNQLLRFHELVID